MPKLALTIAIASCLAATIGSTAKANHREPVRVKHRHFTYTSDFITATRIVGRYYGHSVRDWLIHCSSSEGGHGEFVWYGHYGYPRYGYSNTPGGWMQFMSSTFYSNMEWTFKDARRRGLRVLHRSKSYYEPLGQAIVAGVMYHYHGNPGTWTGAYC